MGCETEHGEPIGEGTKPVPVHAGIANLVSGTTYHFRLVAGNAYGTNQGVDHTVTTPGPTISEEQVTYVEASTATLHATIDPNRGETSYHFEYDTRPYGENEGPHGTSLPVPGVSIGAGTSPVPVSVQAQGLQPGTVYYYRAVAEAEPRGEPESFYGPGKTFTTNPAPGSQNCPNTQRRAEQPFGLDAPRLPCRMRWSRRSTPAARTPSTT